jgi:hypothetical protein
MIINLVYIVLNLNNFLSLKKKNEYPIYKLRYNLFLLAGLFFKRKKKPDFFFIFIYLDAFKLFLKTRKNILK